MERGPSMERSYAIRPVTLALFEDACAALGLDPDQVRTGLRAEMERVPLPEARAFLHAVLDRAPCAPGPEGSPLDWPADEVLVAVRPALRAFFAAAFRHVLDASTRARLYAKKCGADRVLRGGQGGSLSRQLASLDAADCDRLRREMPLREALLYLSLRGIDAFARNPKQYLR